MNWWQSLATREQFLVKLAALVFVIVGGYILIWQPLIDDNVSYRKKIIADHKLLQWMEIEVNRLIALKGHGQSHRLSEDAFLPTIEEEISKEKVLKSGLRKLSAGAEQSISLSFNSVPFDLFIETLTKLKRRFGVTIGSISVTALDDPGLVRVELNLKR